MTEDKKAFVDKIDKALAKSEGLTLKDLLFSYQGTPYPVTVCSVETFQALKNLEARRDDVVLVSYPKCMNWLIQILSDLIFTTLHSKPVGTELPFIECGDPVVWGSYFDHAVTWNKHIEDENTVIIIYEDLKENLTASVKQIAEFFGFSPTAEQIQSIAERATFQAVKYKAQETHGAVGSILFRKGGVGDWKNLFTKAQNLEMDAKSKECLGGTKLGVKLKYDVYCKA